MISEDAADEAATGGGRACARREQRGHHIPKNRHDLRMQLDDVSNSSLKALDKISQRTHGARGALMSSSHALQMGGRLTVTCKSLPIW